MKCRLKKARRECFSYAGLTVHVWPKGWTGRWGWQVSCGEALLDAGERCSRGEAAARAKQVAEQIDRFTSGQNVADSGDRRG